MNAKEFYKAYIEATNVGSKWNINNELMEVYKKDAAFTPVITKIINSIIDTEYVHQNEYFRIDAVGWLSHYEDMKEAAHQAGLKINAHLWDLKIAVEHENNKADWSDEMMKLVHVKCPLKVVIGYSHSDERGDVERQKLDFVAEWMQKIDALNKGTDEEYLIILGNGCSRKTGKSDYTDFGYVGYLFNWETKKFEKLDDC